MKQSITSAMRKENLSGEIYRENALPKLASQQSAPHFCGLSGQGLRRRVSFSFYKTSKRLQNKRGTTLLECVLALAVFTGVSVMIAMMLSTASILQRTSTDTDQALNQVSDEAELSITKAVTETEGTGGELVFFDGGTEVAKQQVRFVKHTAPVADTAAPSTQHVTVWRMGIPLAPPAGS